MKAPAGMSHENSKELSSFHIQESQTPGLELQHWPHPTVKGANTQSL